MPATPIKIARRRAALAKRGLVFASAAVFGVTVGLARASHPATAASPSTSNSSSSASSSTQSSTSTSTFGQATVSPSTSSQAPSVSTGVS